MRHEILSFLQVDSWACGMFTRATSQESGHKFCRNVSRRIARGEGDVTASLAVVLPRMSIPTSPINSWQLFYGLLGLVQTPFVSSFTSTLTRDRLLRRNSLDTGFLL